jgi:hypothetical protein
MTPINGVYGISAGDPVRGVKVAGHWADHIASKLILALCAEVCVHSVRVWVFTWVGCRSSLGSGVGLHSVQV